MNRRIVFNTLGRMLMIDAALLLLPTCVCLIYSEFDGISFIITEVIAIALGALLTFAFKVKSNVIYAKEGFALVASAWIVLSAVGALPFVISGAIPNFFDAFFETVSGFTTTGASILNNVEKLSHGMLFWRSFTHWIGGMGILVFVMAIIPNLSDRSIHIMRAEMPGPVVDKIVPRAKDTAKILYLIYMGMTVLEIVMLVCGGMPFFDSIIHSFGTAGTGGFGIKNDSITSYNAYCQWVIAAFMVIFGVNFNIYFLLLFKKAKNAFKSCELWTYLAIVGVSTSIISINIFKAVGTVSETVRSSFFQVASIISTTGYSTADFDAWPILSKAILLSLMVIGACGGSTAGGIKVSRIVILFKMICRQVKQLIHPRAVVSVKIDGKAADEQTLSSVGVYLGVYVFCVIGIFLLLCVESFNIETNISATLACFNNIGPGLGLVGPTCSYASYSAFSKVILSFAMLLGRLEIFPILIALMPSTWAKR